MENEVAEMKRRLGLSLEQIAKAAGVTKQTAANWESGFTAPSLPRWRKLEAFAAKKGQK